jgi:predicted DNA-binding WGR domain protein
MGKEIPMTEPTIHRKFILNSLESNNNKIWEIEWFPDNTAKSTWGRVGSSTQSKTKPLSFSGVEALIASKMREGYKELELHCPVVAVAALDGTAIDPKIVQLTDLIMRSAGSMINSYLSVTVDALSVNQINRGRTILKKVVDLRSASNRKTRSINFWDVAKRQQLLDLVKQFYNTIPTKLPPRIDPDQIVREFVADLHEQEDRLDQLEAGLATHTATMSGQNPLGDVQIKVTSQTSKAYEQVVDYVLRTAGGCLNVRDVFSVQIPKERKAFEAETVGKSNVLSLFHGTRNHNVRHILRTGLIVPITPANGRRMGDGVYFSDRTQRSLAYCGGLYNQRLLFVADVALGRIWSTSGTYAGKHAPDGYDSTQGTGTWSGHGDEFVVYKRSQQTIKYLVLLD